MTSRLLLTFVAYIVSLAIVVPVAAVLVLVLAGPHAGLLPGWLEPVILCLGWLSVIVLPVIIARRVAARLQPGRSR